MKTAAETQNNSIYFLNQEKTKLEKDLGNYQAQAGALKEEIISKTGIINQRNARLKEVLKETEELNHKIQEVWILYKWFNAAHTSHVIFYPIVEENPR